MLDCSNKALFTHSLCSAFVTVCAPNMNMNMANYFLYSPSPMSLLLLFLCFYIYPPSDLALAETYPSSVILKSKWTNSALQHGIDKFKFKPIIVRQSLDNSSSLFGNSVGICAGFFCNNTCDRSLFAVFVIPTVGQGDFWLKAMDSVVVVWSANRNRLVGENATMELMADGDLVLKDSDGSLVWSTNTSHKSVVGMTIRNPGNLVLFDSSNRTVWDSFDLPTDTLLGTQRLTPGQKLVANISPTNTSEGVFYLSLITGGFAMYANAVSPQMFYRYDVNGTVNYLEFGNDGLKVFYNKGRSARFTLPDVTKFLKYYLRLEWDGHIRCYQWSREKVSWTMVSESLFDGLHFCDYPGSCKGYSICSDGECTCPKGEGDDASFSFKPIDELRPSLGCSPPAPLEGCPADANRSTDQRLLELKQVSYFNRIIDSRSLISNSITKDDCKEICYRNCSCESAFFIYNGANISNGSCFLPSKVFSRLANDPNSTMYNSYAFLNVQNRSPPGRPRTPFAIIAGIGSAAAAVAAGCLVVFLWLRRSRMSINKTSKDNDDDFSFEMVPGLPVRFSDDELRSATQDFSTKLGGDVFGSVFAGILPNGTKIAVKRLEYSGRGQGMKEFRAEVQTIGGINHFNLVKLQGFCADKSHRLLAYEYLENGSLGKWLFSKNSKHILGWNTRFKIALDSARGLAYLHGDCRECIILLDIKPQNILLDEKFNAKISDFGLSRLMSRDESQVITRVRGTPGYVAPELVKYSKVTEKADIYSFGITLLEIVSGRRNVDLSAGSMSDIFLVDMLPQKAKEGKLMDVVDEHLHEEYENIEEEVLRMIKVGMWCALEDFRGRPPMSVIAKELEGAMELDDPPLDSRFSTAAIPPIVSSSQSSTQRNNEPD